jgi:hypothetical protein
MSWKISGLNLLDEERIQKVSRNLIEPAAPAKAAP